MTNLIKQISIDILTLIIGSILAGKISLNYVTYLGFIIMALKVSVVWIAIISVVNLTFLRKI